MEMNKEEIIELLDKLDRDEWCTDLYKTPLTWCELYDIRDYITNLQRENKQLKKRLDKAIEYLNNVPNIKTKIDDKEILIGQTLYQKDITELVKILGRYKGDNNECE